ncbi:MAG: PilN domain-containing protein [Gemmatimonadales bacterium]
MIEINLLPGARKQKRSRSAAFDFRELATNLAARIKDPYLITAAASVIFALVAVGGLFLYQNRKTSTLTEHETKATQDSARYAAVIAQRRAAEAQRDSVVLQLNVIRAIDGSRFVWPHILEEVSRALTPYTWLKSLGQTSAVSSVSPEVEVGLTTGGSKKKTKLEAKADSDAVAAAQLSFRVVGLTIDIQALTRFMTQLEASPWIESVVLVKTDNVTVQPGNKDAIQFTLDMKLQKPDSSLITKAPLSVAVR